MGKEQVEFAKTSLEKASKFKDDPFLRFIILWIGLNALYSIGANRGEETKDKLRNCFKKRKSLVHEVRRNNFEKLKDIECFIEVTPQHSSLRDELKTKKAFLKQNPQSLRDARMDFADFLRQVRNNMFHAKKGWKKELEAKLLRMFNPVLEDLVRRLAEEEEGS